MLGGLSRLRSAGALALAIASAFATSAATPVTPGWSADPDEQFMLDVKLRQYRLGDGVRAYSTPEGTCVVFGDFLTTLDVPMKIDLTARKASGWAFREANRISIDAGSGRVEYAGKAEALAKGAIRETPEGWCVESGALARWFGLGVKPMTAGSVLLLESEAKLPVELAIERERRAAHIKPAKFDLSGLPEVNLPYRMWRTPALDFVVSAGVTYRADTGTRVDRQASVSAAGEIAHLSYDAQLATTPGGVPSRLRLRAYRSDPDGQLLGPIQATHYGFGDVAGLERGLAAHRSAAAAQLSPTGPSPTPAASTGPASKATSRPGGRPSCTATASCSPSPARMGGSVTHLKMFSCSMARTISASCSTVRRGRCEPATRASTSARRTSRPARPGTGPASTSLGARSPP